MLDQLFKKLIHNTIEQPQRLAHRGFHFRNLMICSPKTYDLVSLWKDCYIKWPHDKIKAWAQRYHTIITKHSVTHSIFNAFYRQFELMGIQRHIKILGIFSRLNHRDNKPNYLNDIPLTFHYLSDATSRYPELGDFYQFLSQKIRPKIATIKWKPWF